MAIFCDTYEPILPRPRSKLTLTIVYLLMVYLHFKVVVSRLVPEDLYTLLRKVCTPLTMSSIRTTFLGVTAENSHLSISHRENYNSIVFDLNSSFMDTKEI